MPPGEGRLRQDPWWKRLLGLDSLSRAVLSVPAVERSLRAGAIVFTLGNLLVVGALIAAPLRQSDSHVFLGVLFVVSGWMILNASLLVQRVYRWRLLADHPGRRAGPLLWLWRGHVTVVLLLMIVLAGSQIPLAFRELILGEETTWLDD